MTDVSPATAPESRALILVGTEPRSGLVLPLGTILDVSTSGRLGYAMAGWTDKGWADVHPALEYLTYRRLSMAEATQYLAQHPVRPTSDTTKENP